MAYTLAELAQLVSGTVLGDDSIPVRGANPLGCAVTGDITLLDNAEKTDRLINCPATAVVAPRGVRLALPMIEVDDVHAAFAQLVMLFRPPRTLAPVGRSPSAVIHPSARLADDVQVYPGAVIGEEVEIGPGTVVHAGATILAGCRIAEQVTIFPGAVLYENTELGPRVVVHAGAVLGAYGFGYKLVAGRHQRAAQLGFVRVEADVEIGASTTIDRGSYGPTIIGEGTKIDNQVMIGHNCRIGRHNLICSQVGIAGSTTTGDYVVMGGQVGVRDHVHIGSGAQLGAQCGVAADVPDNAAYLGSPATPIREQTLSMIAFQKLPELRREVKNIRRLVDQLARRLDDAQDQRAA